MRTRDTGATQGTAHRIGAVANREEEFPEPDHFGPERGRQHLARDGPEAIDFPFEAKPPRTGGATRVVRIERYGRRATEVTAPRAEAFHGRTVFAAAGRHALNVSTLWGFFTVIHTSSPLAKAVAMTG